MKLTRILIVALAILLIGSPVLADAVIGDEIISIGADLTEEQRNSILIELGANDNSQIIEVTNREEHEYLGGFIPAEKIGTQALSSAKITIQNEGEGVDIDVSDNIIYITEDIYRNALLTAGINDADVEITAPGSVTGTGALTGILKAYETLTGENIPEDVKKIANEELVVTYELGESVGNSDATKLINEIKVQFSENMPENEEEARTLIINISNNYNVNLTDAQVEQLVSLFMRMKNSNVDWNKLADTAAEYSDRASEYLSSDEGQSFLQSLKTAFSSFIDWIANLFS